MARKNKHVRQEEKDTATLALSILQNEPLITVIDVSNILGCTRQYVDRVARDSGLGAKEREEARNRYLESIGAKLYPFAPRKK